MSLDLLVMRTSSVGSPTVLRTLPNGQQHELAQRANQILPLRRQQHKLAQRTGCPPWQAYMRRSHSCARLIYIRPITGSASLSCRSPVAYQHYHTCKLAILQHEEDRMTMPRLQHKEVTVAILYLQHKEVSLTHWSLQHKEARLPIFLQHKEGRV